MIKQLPSFVSTKCKQTEIIKSIDSEIILATFCSSFLTPTRFSFFLFQLLTDQTKQYQEYKEWAERKQKETSEYHKNEVIKEKDTYAKVIF